MEISEGLSTRSVTVDERTGSPSVANLEIALIRDVVTEQRGLPILTRGLVRESRLEFRVCVLKADGLRRIDQIT